MQTYGPAQARCFSKPQWVEYNGWDEAYQQAFALMSFCLRQRNRVLYDSVKGRPYAAGD